MQGRWPRKIFQIAVLVSLTAAHDAFADCPSSTDRRYVVKKKEHLSLITATNYALWKTPALTDAWKVIAEYNKARIGNNPHLVFEGTELCLPQVLEAVIGKPQLHTISNDTQPAPASCGNGKRDTEEVCDGEDLGELSCATLGLSGGELQCAKNCRAFDPSRCGPPPIVIIIQNPSEKREPIRLPEQKDQPWHIDFAVELMSGALVPLSTNMRDDFFRASWAASLGARVVIQWLELTPRALLVLGNHNTVFNDREQPQSLLGLGGGVQAGIPIRWSRFHLTPGVETTFLYMRRKIDRIDYPYEGVIEDQRAWIPWAGLFVRPEAVFRPAWASGKEITIGLDTALIAFFRDGVDNGWTDNFGVKASGGVSYAF